MTDWIDQLATTLPEGAALKNQERATRLHQDALLQVQGPPYLTALTEAARTLSTELNQKLGATLGPIKFDGHAFGFRVSNTARLSAKVSCQLNLKDRQIEVGTNYDGGAFVNGGSQAYYHLQVNEHDQMTVRTATGDTIASANELASIILRRAFSPDLLQDLAR